MTDETKLDDGGPAFPGAGEFFTTDAQGRTLPQSAWGIEGAKGMTLRAYLTAKALPAVYAQHVADGQRDGFRPGWHTGVAIDAVSVADAVLAELRKGQR